MQSSAVINSVAYSSVGVVSTFSFEQIVRFLKQNIY